MGLLNFKYLPRVINSAEENKYILQQYRSHLKKHQSVYIDLNNPGAGLINVMMFDIDAGNAPLAWYDSIPFQPAWFAGKWKNGQLDRAHGVLKLKIPVKKSNFKSLKLFNAIYAEIAIRLTSEGCKVDLGQKATTKNPDCKHWDVIVGDQREWTLYELAEALGLDVNAVEYEDVFSQARGKINEEYAALGRNCEVFENARRFAYNTKNLCISEQDLYDRVMDECRRLNLEYREMLPESEIRSITKSISSWTWYRYVHAGKVEFKDRGAARDLFSALASTEQRQRMGAYYTAAKKAQNNWKSVYEARKGHSEANRTEIAELLKMNIKTVRKYWNITNADDIEIVKYVKALRHHQSINRLSEGVSADVICLPFTRYLGAIRKLVEGNELKSAGESAEVEGLQRNGCEEYRPLNSQNPDAILENYSTDAQSKHNDVGKVIYLKPPTPPNPNYFKSIPVTTYEDDEYAPHIDIQEYYTSELADDDIDRLIEYYENNEIAEERLSNGEHDVPF